jgi:transcriptional regulator with XRE-family HTH domain
VSSRTDKSGIATAGIIGLRLKELRKQNDWRLSDVAQKTGISVGTLSKLENGKTELNFTSVNKLAAGLGVRVTELTSPRGTVSGQRTLTRASSGVSFETPDIHYELLCNDMSHVRQGYLRGKVISKRFDPEMPWHRHDGQEFLFILSGTLMLYSEHYDPVELNAGDSILFDSSMGHHYVSKGRKPAEILIAMSLDGYENVSDSLRSQSGGSTKNATRNLG